MSFQDQFVQFMSTARNDADVKEEQPDTQSLYFSLTSTKSNICSNITLNLPFEYILKSGL